MEPIIKAEAVLEAMRTDGTNDTRNYSCLSIEKKIIQYLYPVIQGGW